MTHSPGAGTKARCYSAAPVRGNVRHGAWRSIVGAGVVAFVQASAGDARAQSNPAIAEKLFLEGNADLKAGRVHEACQKLADSQRLDPAVGTLMHLALCHQKEHRNATAWSEFTDVAAQAQKAGQKERERFAREHADALEKQLQKLVIEVAPAPPGTVIELDGQVLPATLLGSDVPVDPGDHAIAIHAPGKMAWERPALRIEPGVQVTRIRATLEDAPSSAPAVPPPPAGSSQAAAAPEPAPSPASSSETAPTSPSATRKILGYSAAGAALVLFGVAAVELGTSIGRSNDESKYPQGSDARKTVADQSSQAMTYAIAFGAGGLVAAGASVFLLFAGPGDTRAPAAARPRSWAAPYVSDRGGGVVWSGAF